MPSAARVRFVRGGVVRMVLNIVILVLLKGKELYLFADIVLAFLVRIVLSLQTVLVVCADVLVNRVVGLVEGEVKLRVCLRAGSCSGLASCDVALTFEHPLV